MNLTNYQDEYERIMEKLKNGEKISVSEWSLIEQYEETKKIEERLIQKYNSRRIKKRGFKDR